MKPSWKKIAEELLTRVKNESVVVEDFQPVGGGCINECFRISATTGNFFLKKNLSKNYPAMLKREAEGLQLLNHSVKDIAPTVIVQHEDETEQLLILEWIETGNPAVGFWKDFAEKLSLIHRSTSESFGFDHDNYIGSLPQSNRRTPDWIIFFTECRIEPQLKMAIDNKNLNPSAVTYFNRLFPKLSEIFPLEKPALLHGDLWSGNFMVGREGFVRLIDPAVYFGHREMDLAMTKLFGGFDRSFYQYYQEYASPEPGFEKRSEIYNLYPLLVHVNLFGGSYAQQVIEILKRF